VLAEIYIPDTGITNPPVVVQQVSEAMPDVTRSLPAVALMDIDEELNILDESGNAISTVDAFYETYRWTVVPAFVVDSQAESDAISDYLKSAQLIDAYVFAELEDVDLVTSARKNWKNLRGGVIVDSVGKSSEDYAAFIAYINDDRLVTQVLSREAVTVDTMAYFNSRQVALWSYANDTAGVYNAISAGYHAVVLPEPALAYDVYEGYEGLVLSGRPIGIAHRGAHLDYGASIDPNDGQYGMPENTIAAFRMAIEKYGCLNVETDLRITKACDPATCDHDCDHANCSDCQPNIVLEHDGNMLRTTNIEDIYPFAQPLLPIRRNIPCMSCGL
jgi:hypothetical protein